MSVTFIHICKDCHQPFHSKEPEESRCFFCKMAAEEEEILPAEPGDFDQFVYENSSTSEEWSAWQRFCEQMGYEVPHFRSEYIGSKTEARRVTEKCKDCNSTCISRDGCPFKGD